MICCKGLAVTIVWLFMFSFSEAQEKTRPRILISTDIGGTDPDDNQSMIHLLMYSDLFQIEGLVSTVFKGGSVNNILEMINLYETDLPKLSQHSKNFPSPDTLRKITKQGAVTGAPYKGFALPTEGSKWIINCAHKITDQPLWILVWGGLEDLAQALHDDPSIEKKIRVYWIGGPNKKWGVNAYAYLAEHHPNLWMIENNATYRGWFMDASSPEKLKGKQFYASYISNRGAMGKDFGNYYKGEIKMGDTPSFAYLLNGNADDPTGESWGGSFTSIRRSSRIVFNRATSFEDTVPTYAVLEWKFIGPVLNISPDSSCFSFDINGQKWPGYYLGNGNYGVRYSPKQAETGSYILSSHISELNGITGKYVSVAPWPGKSNTNDYKLGTHWYSDRSEPDLFLGEQQGAVTISKYREAYLMDWAKRWNWLQ